MTLGTDELVCRDGRVASTDLFRNDGVMNRMWMLCLSWLVVGGCGSSTSPLQGGADAGAVAVDSEMEDAGLIVDGGFVCPDGRIADGTEGSPCLFATPCAEGLACNIGCTDDLDVCMGECHDEDDANAFCRQGRCTYSVDADGGVLPGGCGEAERCAPDGFCYGADF